MILLLLLLLIPTNAHADVEALIDGSIKFSTSVPMTQLEIDIANSSMTFTNFSDLVFSLNDKAHLNDKIDDIPASTARKKANEIQLLKNENARRP